MADGLHFDDGLLEWAETFGATPVDAADDLLFTATSLLEDSSLNMAHTSAAPRYPDVARFLAPPAPAAKDASLFADPALAPAAPYSRALCGSPDAVGSGEETQMWSIAEDKLAESTAVSVDGSPALSPAGAKKRPPSIDLDSFAAFHGAREGKSRRTSAPTPECAENDPFAALPSLFAAPADQLMVAGEPRAPASAPRILTPPPVVMDIPAQPAVAHAMVAPVAPCYGTVAPASSPVVAVSSVEPIARSAARQVPGAWAAIPQVAPAAPAVPEPVDEAAREALLHECCRVMLSDPEVLRTRATTHAEFAKRKGSFRGVTFHRRTAMYEGHLWHDGKQLYLGSFPTPALAARAHDVMAVGCRGQRGNACLNYPPADYATVQALAIDLSVEVTMEILKRISKMVKESA